MRKDFLRQEVKDVYKVFWKPIFGFRGLFNFKQVKKELHDFHICIKEVPKVYMHVTNGMISKPNTLAYEVTGEYDYILYNDYVNNMEIEDILKRFDKMTKKEIKKELEDLLCWKK